jgi:CBS domain containing-hemolysin-like protein
VEENSLSKGKDKCGNRKGNNKIKLSWIMIILVWTIMISGTVSLFSDLLLRNVNILVAFVILIFIIFIGIAFDIIGVAVTAGQEMPFHAMASKKIKGAKIAINMIRNADKVSSFCNDVIGDVCGIVSGSVGAIICAKIVFQGPRIMNLLSTAVIGALIASLTVAGKAVGKNYAINNSNDIIFKVSKIIYILKKDR